MNQKELLMRHFQHLFSIAVLLTLIWNAPASAQTLADARTYRVVAYKKGNNNVTSVSNTTEVVPNMSIFIPNSFTPNGDGLNDTFGIYGEAIREYQMQVFNRWGQKVFETNTVETRWDGTFEGVHVPEGTYVYQVSARGNQGNTLTRNGTVHLVY